MATTERDYDPRDPLASLDESIRHYAACDDEASSHQVRRLRTIRRGILAPHAPAIVTAACPATQR